MPVVEQMLSMCEALGSILSTNKQTKSFLVPQYLLPLIVENTVNGSLR
jgi:hypothetical protein